MSNGKEGFLEQTFRIRFSLKEIVFSSVAALALYFASDPGSVQAVYHWGRTTQETDLGSELDPRVRTRGMRGDGVDQRGHSLVKGPIGPKTSLSHQLGHLNGV